MRLHQPPATEVHACPVSLLTGANHLDSRRPKKKKRAPLGLGPGAGGGGGQLVGGVLTGGGGGGSSSGGSGSISQGNAGVPTKKKRPKLPAPSIPSIFDHLN